MKISELAGSNGKMAKGTRLKVRVPARLQEKLGTKVVGEFAGLPPKTGKVQLVYVKVNGKRMVFRPQDLQVTR